ncbi:MAG TPA: FG-GAP repeat protein [Caproiciproducens sp.]|nr:FG-GAP repeat protein [Caproiciproducens sp.]
MKFTKEHLCDLPFCYAVSPVTLNGRLHYVFATDDTGPCCCIDAETHKAETVWDEPGGTMSVVPVPNSNGDFLASQRFFPGFRALDCRIVRALRENGVWKVNPWLDLPYVHRFDILERGGVYYLLCCILSTTQNPQTDWKCPGVLMAAELNADFSPPKHLDIIAQGMTKNHGYCRVECDGFSKAFTACDEGVFEVLPPERRGGAWTVKKILETHASDVAVCDIDGDGEDELAVIEPFHGTDFVVYHKKENQYTELYRYPNKMDFVHVVWGGKLCGEPVFLGGCRAVDKELFVLRWKHGTICAEQIENGKGPSNVAVIHGAGEDTLLVANRESAEAAVFSVQADGEE